MTETEQRRAGRPRRPVLSLSRIGDAALAVVDETGDFTLPEVARRLGVQTASLYHHVDGRAGVVELLRAQLAEPMVFEPLEDGPWEEALRTYFRSYRAVFAAHPRVVPLLTTTPVRSPQVVRAYELVVGRLTEAGVPDGDLMAILTALENFVIGSALDLAAPEVMWEVSEDVEAPRLADALAAQERSSNRADAAFEFGLETLLAGIVQRGARRG